MYGLDHLLFYVTLLVQGKQVQMELDTGAAVSAISEQTYEAIWDDGKSPPIQPAKVQSHMYTGQTIIVIRVVIVTVNHQQQTKQLLLLIVKGESPTLLGRGWLTQLILNIACGHIHHVQVQETLSRLLDEH